MNRLRAMILSGLFVAMEIVLTRMLSIAPVDTMRFSLGFLPVALAGALLGPFWGAATATVADFIGATLVVRAPFHPGITFNALLIGAAFGFAFYRKRMSVPRTLAAVAIIDLSLDVLLKSVWLSGLFSAPYYTVAASRLAQAAIMLPIKVGAITLVWRHVGRRFAWRHTGCVPGEAGDSKAVKATDGV